MLVELLKAYHHFEKTQHKGLISKAGLGTYNHPALELVLTKLILEPVYYLDATGTAGAFSCLHGIEKGVILDTSFTSLKVARENSKGKPGLELLAAPIWSAPKARFERVVSRLSTDKGNARVEAEIMGIHQALSQEGKAYIVSHKDQGAKRYEKLLTDYFSTVKVVAKDKGWRLVEASQKKEAKPAKVRQTFEALGLSFEAEPGVYAAGKLDPGTAFLLETYDLSDVMGKKVLDLGCGYGLISLKAALAGAELTALDDDFLAIQSAYQNAKNYGLDIRLLHSDVDSELKKDEQFDLVLSNPPFHVGKQVKLELPHAFIAAAFVHLKPGGEFVMVANKALNYEPLLKEFSFWDKVAENKMFKVLRAIK